jgi:hypothetical protein
MQTRATIAADVAHPALEYEGFPELFVEPINRYWLTGSRVVIRVLLEQQHRSLSEWAVLGQQLSAQLLTSGQYVGICFDGNPCFGEVIFDWLRSIREVANQKRVSDGVVELKWILSPHPVIDRGNLNVTWTSIQAIQDSAWVKTIWAAANGNTFHVGCDLILTTYAMNAWRTNPWDEPLTIKDFLATLEHAEGWLIPLSHNDGYLLGLSQESSWFNQLTVAKTASMKESEQAAPPSQ